MKEISNCFVIAWKAQLNKEWNLKCVTHLTEEGKTAKENWDEISESLLVEFELHLKFGDCCRERERGWGIWFKSVNTPKTERGIKTLLSLVCGHPRLFSTLFCSTALQRSRTHHCHQGRVSHGLSLYGLHASITINRLQNRYYSISDISGRRVQVEKREGRNTAQSRTPSHAPFEPNGLTVMCYFICVFRCLSAARCVRV